MWPLHSSLQNVCHTLWCSVGTTCHSKLDAAVDGTSCGESKVGEPQSSCRAGESPAASMLWAQPWFTDSPVLSADPQPSLARVPICRMEALGQSLTEQFSKVPPPRRVSMWALFYSLFKSTVGPVSW